MTRAELTKKIAEVEEREFMLKMKDYWTWKDYERSRKYTTELFELRRQLKTVAE